MSIFGISMIDLYGLSIFSAFFTEISEITANILNYLTTTKFYAIISGYFGYKIEKPTKIGPMNRTDSSATGVSKEIEGKSRVSD
jgi:hypothetical protein